MPRYKDRKVDGAKYEQLVSPSEGYMKYKKLSWKFKIFQNKNLGKMYRKN